MPFHHEKLTVYQRALEPHSGIRIANGQGEEEEEEVDK